MVAVPYFLLGGFGYVIYRGLKTTYRQNEERLRHGPEETGLVK